MTMALAILLLVTTQSPREDFVLESLGEHIVEILGNPAVAEAKVGVLVVRLDDDKELFALRADDVLVPASNMKIVTTAAALHYLGPDYHFKTELYGKADPQGVIRGDLYIKGYGDPWLLPERLWNLANRVRYLGVKAIKGNIVVDSSYFSGPNMANGWEQDRTANAYMAKSGAVSLGFNAVLIHVLPHPNGEAARVLVEPESKYVAIENTATTVTRGRTRLKVDIEPLGARSVVKVSGHISANDPGRGYWRRVDNPPIFTGEVFKSLLTGGGVAVKGRVIEGNVPAEAERLVAMGSPRLAEILLRVNKHSNNFMADQVARTLGAVVISSPGSWEKGKQAIESFLEDEVGIERGTYMIGNASGLHDVNRMSPRQLVMVLAHMRRDPHTWPEFLSSLAVAGGAGTLSERMRESDAEQMLRAKTGTLSTASALSGYVVCKSGENLAFSILVNDYKVDIQDVWRVQDDLGKTLASLDFTMPPPLTESPDGVKTLGSLPGHPTQDVGVGRHSVESGKASAP
ncbi:MAG: D-alanyl-D-alanine carboxypeptidase/D-alanyl-D-alanine-endopeptidase [Deltaproteobacteria bacterium RIFOXYA12_FULL_58_15]|nr:MAG: D-alanyl-D-alanine carboxypeptidase/D-alanyl-D-alanine-endopeptidase [Deltaproteobacteria bacterium RIFOXYA12_FULL_58_15]OGR07252.1 MAG: D-alanyl-D-alanine carboxypeptidase/D-alanyl-D-alanine-endopeptidase [Deltaproteobacteria bacterium RIFOXYB12_FULL_58_9]